MARRCVLIRHGDVGEQYHGRFIGSTDVELSDLGLRQAAALAAKCADLRDAVCLCSPMRRTVQTAELATVGDSMLRDTPFRPEAEPLRPEPDLREFDFGEWEGLTFEEISRQYADLVDSWAVFNDDFACPAGECIRDFCGRIRRVGRMVSEHPSETVVLFTHGGVIRSLICHFLGLEMRNYLLFEVSRASVSEVTLFGEKGVLTRLNDVSHLEVTGHR